MESKIDRAGLIFLIMCDRLQVPVFTEKLRGYGYNDIEACSDGKAALEKMSETEPVVVITDVDLKGKLNGIETGKKIRDQYDLPLIYMSRLQDEKTFQKALDTHPHAFLSKPVNWNELRMAIESAFQRNIEKKGLDSLLKEYRQMYNDAPLHSYTLDEEGHFISVNQAWTELTGYSPDELTGHSFSDFVSPGDYEEFKQNFEKFKREGIIHKKEFDILGKNGQKITISLSGKIHTDMHGKFRSMHCILTDITEKKRLQERLEESEERFRLLFEEAPLGYQSLAADGCIIYINNTWCKLLGYSKKEAIGKWFGDFLAPDDKERFKNNFSVFKKKGSACNIQYEMIKKDGGKIYVSIDGTVRYDDNGNYIQSHYIIKDITEQKKLEQELKDQLHFSEMISDTPSISVFIYDIQKEMNIWVNNTHRKMLEGLIDQDLCMADRDVIMDVIHPDDRQVIESVLDRVVKSQSDEFTEIEYRISDGSGSWRWLRERKSVFRRDEQGNVLQFMGMAIDITNTKIAQEELIKREQEIKLITDNIPALISYLDKNGMYLYVNKQCEKWFGISSDKIIGKHYREVLGEITYEQIKDYVNEALSGKQLTYDDELNYAHGGKRWITAEYIPDFDDNGQVSGFYALVTDITERKQAEESLRTSEERYRALADSITDVFFAMDKDLKYTFWNKASEKLTGISEQQAIGKHLMEIFPDTPQLRKVERVYLDVLKNKKAMTFINDFSLGDRNFVFEISAYPAGEDISVFVKDITERKKMESELFESRQMLQIVLDTIPVGVFWKDRDLFYRGGNRTFLNANRFNHSGEVIGKTDYDFPWGKETADLFREIDKKVMESGIPEFNIIESVTLTNGTHSWSRTNKVPMRDTEGNIIGILGTFEDITRRKQAEEALLNSEAQLSNAMKIAKLGYWEYDVAEDIFTFDDHFYSIFHTTAEKVGGYKMSSARYADLFVHPEDRHMVGSEIRNALETTDPDYSRQLEHRMIYADGSTGYISVRFFIVKDDQGRTIRTYGANQDITERKKAERRLQESEERYRQVFENYPVGIVLTDPGKKFISANPSFCKMLEYSEEELKGMTFLDITHPDHRDADKEKVESLWQDMITEYRTEKRYIAKNGSLLWGNLISTLVRGQDGQPLYALAMINDITDRKKAETELLTSEARFKAFMDNLPVMTYIKDKNGKYVYGNKANLKLEGITLNQFRDTEVSDYLPANLAKWMKQMDKKVMITGKAIELDEWRYIKGNIERWFTEYKFPITVSDEEQLIGGWMMDITRRKAVESALKESEKIYKDLVEKAGIAIMTDDINGNITYFNREFARLFDYTMSGIKKQSRETLIHREDLQRMISYHNKRMKGEKVPDHYEVRGIRKNGDEIWIEVKTTVLEEKNKITGTRNYMWDITEREKFQEAIKNSEARFRELFSNMSNGVAIYKYIPESDKFVFRDMNKAGMRICRIKKMEEIAGRNIIDCFPGVETLGLIEVMKKVWETGRPEKVENNYYLDNRIELYVENKVYKLPTGEIVSVFDDITERMEAELELKESYKQIKKLSRHVEAIREEERKQIARNLHDDLGQMLTAIKMDVSWIRNKIPQQERKGIKKRIKSTIDITDKAIRSVSRLSSELRPGVLDDLGLMEALKEYLRDYEKRIGIKIRTNLPEKDPKLKPDQDISVYRIIQEALTNVARHAHATEADLTMKEKNSNLEIRIHDNGTGISKDKVQSPESFGILSMKERVLGWGGSFEIRGARNRGTTINIIMPVL